MRSLWKVSLIVLVSSFPLCSVGCSGGSYMSEDAATIPADQEDDTAGMQDADDGDEDDAADADDE